VDRVPESREDMSGTFLRKGLQSPSRPQAAGPGPRPDGHLSRRPLVVGLAAAPFPTLPVTWPQDRHLRSWLGFIIEPQSLKIALVLPAGCEEPTSRLRLQGEAGGGGGSAERTVDTSHFQGDPIP
jgi:hypothetical protein